MKLIVKALLLTVLTLGTTTTPKAIAVPPGASAGRFTFGPLPGGYAIRTYDRGFFFSAPGSGPSEVDPIITPNTFPTTSLPDEKFRLETRSPNFTLLKTPRGHYVSAQNGGGLGGTDDGKGNVHTLATLPSMTNNALFTIRSADPGFSPFTIRTVRNFFLTAIAGGGKSREAFSSNRTQYGGSWEAFQVLKCGDLGSDYDHDYAIKPWGFGPGAPPLQAHDGGGRVKDSLGFFKGGAFYGRQRFKLRRQSDGSYSLRTSNLRNYVTAIGGGGLASGTKDWDNLVTDRTQVQAWEKFRIVDKGDCIYTIQTTNNWFVGWHPTRGFSTRHSDPQYPAPGYTTRFELIPFLR